MFMNDPGDLRGLMTPSSSSPRCVQPSWAGGASSGTARCGAPQVNAKALDCPKLSTGNPHAVCNIPYSVEYSKHLTKYSEEF